MKSYLSLLFIGLFFSILLVIPHSSPVVGEEIMQNYVNNYHGTSYPFQNYSRTVYHDIPNMSMIIRESVLNNTKKPYILNNTKYEVNPITKIELKSSSDDIQLLPFFPGGMGYSCDCLYDEKTLECYTQPKYEIFLSGSYIVAINEKNDGASIKIEASDVLLNGNGMWDYIDITKEAKNVSVSNFIGSYFRSNGDYLTVFNNHYPVIDSTGDYLSVFNNNYPAIDSTGNYPTIFNNNNCYIHSTGDYLSVFNNNYPAIDSTGNYPTIFNNNNCSIHSTGENAHIFKNKNDYGNYTLDIISSGDNSQIIDNEMMGFLWNDGSNTTIKNNIIKYSLISDGDNNWIENNRIIDKLSELRSIGNNNTVQNNVCISISSGGNYTKILNNEVSGYYQKYSRGLSICGVFNNIINNTISNPDKCGIGFVTISKEENGKYIDICNNNANSIISGNKIIDTYDGIFCVDYDNLTISNNEILNNYNGINCWLKNSLVSDNNLTNNANISLNLKGHNTRILNNNIINNDKGIKIDGNDLNFTGNIISNNLNYGLPFADFIMRKLNYKA